MSSLRAPLRDEEFGIDTSETGYNQSTNQSMPFKALPRKFKILIGVLTILVLIFVIALAAVSSKRVREIVFGPDPAPTPFDPDAPSQSFALHELGVDMDASRDMTADPCEDFYQYACGGWVASTDLGNASSITKGFTGAQAVNQRYIKDILEEDWPIVSPFYDACMDIDRINARGVQPIMHLMNMLNPDLTWLNTTHEVFEMWGFLRAQFRTPILFSLGVRANSTNPRQALLSMDAGGLTSNSWRYYANNRTDLEASVAKMFMLIGDNSTTAARFASLAIGFEAKLVNITDRASINRTINNTLTESLEAQNLELPMDLLQVFAPDIPFAVYFQGTGLLHTLNRTSTPFDVSYRDLDGLVLINQLVSNATIQELVAYSRWRLLEYTSQYLSMNVQQTYGETVGVLLKGATDIVDRSPQCTNMVVNGLSDLFGRYFVERRLPIAARMTAKNMLTWIKQAFEDVLPSVSWMDDPTRAVALEKAKAVAELVGGPMDGNWSDYSQVWLTRETFWENVYSVEAMKIAEDWKKLTAPISRFTFVMNPTLVNAAYSPSANSMNFPAGILNEPFFSFDYPMSVNLGRIGMVEGHELMHGFDNSGRQYDKDGFRRDWWNASIVQAFTQTTQCMIDQYQNVQVQGSTINGKKTLGENIADNSGIKLAYIAFKKYEAELKAAGYSDPVPGPKDTKNPLTSDQLFYWAHAQTWCTKATDRAIANQVLTDVHSPGQARVWVTVTNQPEFAEAFQCKAGSRMNPVNKCIIY